MLVGWLLDAALMVLGFVLEVFGFLPTFVLPAALTLNVPVPLLSSGTITVMNTWFVGMLGITAALIVGKVLQWAYSLIPFKMT